MFFGALGKIRTKNWVQGASVQDFRCLTQVLARFVRRNHFRRFADKNNPPEARSSWAGLKAIVRIADSELGARNAPLSLLRVFLCQGLIGKSIKADLLEHICQAASSIHGKSIRNPSLRQKLRR